MFGSFACTVGAMATGIGFANPSPKDSIPILCRPGERAILSVEAETQAGRFRPLRMILDTGAALCVVDTVSAQGLVNGMFQVQEATGFAGRPRRVLKRTLKGLRLGKVSQSSVPVLVMDLSERNKWLDEPVDGLLGMSFLAGRHFLVDPSRASLVWEGELPLGRSLPLKARGSYFYTTVKVAGVETEVLLDTGASGTLYVSSLPRGLALEADCEMASGIDGFVRLGRARADLELIGETFLRRPLWVGGSSSAILGAAFLLAGPTVFDLRRDRILLSVDAAGKLLQAPSIPAEVSFPICWNRKGAEPFLEVAPMPACHRWQRAGFQAGDRVLAVGATSGRGLSLAGINGLIRDGQVLVWTLQRKGRALEVRNPPENRRLDRLDEQDEGDALSPPSPPAAAATPPVR